MPRKRMTDDQRNEHTILASMRPGHCAPEKGPSARFLRPRFRLASMRPGHCAPEKGFAYASGISVLHRFNEAGALCPGKGAVQLHQVPLPPVASMRPGHCAPEKGRGWGIWINDERLQ